MLKCSKCRIDKEETEFNVQKGTKRGRVGYCKPCMAEWRRERYVPKIDRKPCPQCGTLPEGRKRRFCSRACSISWHNAQPDRVLDRRDRNLKKQVGIGLAEYNVLLVAQDGKCLLCGCPEAGSRHGVLDVDHCHDTGRVRGLLCHRCNWALGILGDDPALLRRAADYLDGKFAHGNS